MKRKKTLQELTIKDNFMFGAVMCDEKHCRRFLEMALEFPIERVEVSKEKSIVYHPQYKGVRLDVYAKDEKNTHYNVEMQAVKKDSLFRRSRYYHSQIDMELLLSGATYSELKKSREMEERFMLLELMLQDERREGREEGRAEGKAEAVICLLENLAYVPNELRENIMGENNLTTLNRWLILAANVKSIEQFMNQM